MRIYYEAGKRSELMAEMENKLPEAFLARMKNMLGDEYDDFIMAFEKENPYIGMRISLLKKNSKEAVFSESRLLLKSILLY